MVDNNIFERMRELVAYLGRLKGDEKGEAQVFCDRLFHAFGHKGYKEAGAVLEERVEKRGGKGTRFADLVWRPRLLLEMKSRGEPLQKHYRQAFDYWVRLVPDRPRYVVLCNFDEMWVYDFNLQVDSPMDRLQTAELASQYTALNFLFPEEEKPLFGNDKVQVTREAADKVAAVFAALVERKLPREQAQRFILQSVVAMFAEDCDLLPKALFTTLVEECKNGGSSYDLIGGLFRQMASPKKAGGGRFADVKYFNGGLFSVVDPIELKKNEIELLIDASRQKWDKVAPPIFGTLFQGSMDQGRRHALGAHFTSEADIQEIVRPTIVHPWMERVEAAKTLRALKALSEELLRFKVLDPACGSGNFLYVAYRELVHIEMEILRRIHEEFGDIARRKAGAYSLVSPHQFYGIDIDPFAAELAKVTLMLAKRVAVAEALDAEFRSQDALPFEFGSALPLDNLDDNIVAGDALLREWPKVDAIIGNPPYQSKNKMQEEFGRAYLNSVRDRYPDVDGRADYCVYWFRRAHDELPEAGRAGLVGTNTIRQNYSRMGGLDYIVGNGGAITNAWATKVWSGDAVVHVSIVNWVKGEAPTPRILFRQDGDMVDSPISRTELPFIASSLSGGVDVTKALDLACNQTPKTTHQGQTHGHEGFLLSREEAAGILATDPKCAHVIKPFLTIDEVLEATPASVQRFVIDFSSKDLESAAKFKEPFRRVQEIVLPKRKEAAQKETERNAEALAASPKATVNRHHENFLKHWWRLSYSRPELMKQLGSMSRYIACGRVTRRPVFVMIPVSIQPNDAIQVFAFQDDYSFGILASQVHWTWFTERCSTLKADWRYTSTTVWDSFPWPQHPTAKQVKDVAVAARALRELRRELLAKHALSLRELYRHLELPGAHPLKDAQAELDDRVRAAYGMKARDDVTGFLFNLNDAVARAEAGMKSVTAPGFPGGAVDVRIFTSKDVDIEWNGF